MTKALANPTLSKAFEKNPLFEDKTWRRSPSPFAISRQQAEELEKIGEACLEFYHAMDKLHHAAYSNKSLLRNKELLVPWVCDYLDSGKPQYLLEHARNSRFKKKIPPILRPDLMLTEDGFKLTELDCVPGGCGLTAFLNELYADAFPSTIGGKEQMLKNYYQALAATASKIGDPFIALVVNEEAITYLPEHLWITEKLQAQGKKVDCLKPEDLIYKEDGVYGKLKGQLEKIDIIYRFFELFDLPHIPNIKNLFEAVESGKVALTPPMKPHHEEKMNLALFHHPILKPFWQESLSKPALTILKNIVPKSYILDPTKVPANATLLAPTIDGEPITDWNQLAEGSQKNRNFIIKISGFHETAWGARSVVLGSDCSQIIWSETLQAALSAFPNNPFILQDYEKPKTIPHPIYQEDSSIKEENCRVRLCPYYAVIDNKAKLSGALATLCPADKKIIHGMQDAALLPTIVKELT